MNQHIRYHQMSIECQYMSNICQTQMKGKQNNETNKRNKRKQEKGPRGISRSKGSKTSNIMRHYETGEVSQTRRFEGFVRGFPLHHLSYMANALRQQVLCTLI